MGNLDKRQLDLEKRIHSLICGDLDEQRRQETLSLIAHDKHAQGILSEMIDVQRSSRAAFGFDHVDEAIARSMPHLDSDTLDKQGQQRLREKKQQTPKGQHFLHLTKAGWLWRIAAMFVIAASAYIALSNYISSQNLDEQLAEIRQSIAKPTISLSADDVSRLRTVWSEVSGSGNAGDTWILLNNGSGEFGSIDTPADTMSRGKVLLVQYRIVDESGSYVYTADLLMPDRKTLKIDLPDAGKIVGRPASLTFAAAKNKATIGFAVDGIESLPVGVLGQTLIGDKSEEVGSFSLNGNSMRVFARTRRLQGFQI